jgi:hypothetical protein
VVLARERRLLRVAWFALPLGALVVFDPAAIALVVPTTVGVLALGVLCTKLRDPEGTPEQATRLVAWTMGALFGHLIFGLIVTNTPRAVYYLGGDAGTYHTYATWITEFGTKSLTHGLQQGKEGFYYTLVALYKVFGPHKAAGLALNATLSAAMVPLLADVARRLFGSAAAREVPPMVVLFPTVFLFTSQLLKEAPILFLLVGATDAAVRMADRITLVNLAVFTGAVALLLTFRGPIALVGGAGLVAGVAVAKREVLSGLTAGVSTVAVLAVFVLVVGVGYSGVRDTLQSSNLAATNNIRSGLANGSNTGFGSDVDTSTARRALSYLPVGLSRFAIGPFPWELRSVRELPAMADVAVLWALLPSAFRGYRQGFRRIGRRLAVLVGPAVTIAIVLSLSVGNIGILVRERMQVFVLVVPVMALGLSLRHPQPEPVAAPAREPALLP